MSSRRRSDVDKHHAAATESSPLIKSEHSAIPADQRGDGANFCKMIATVVSIATICALGFWSQTTTVPEKESASVVKIGSFFPSDFVWGVATSAYQIEGAVAEDGRGETIWDTFVRVPGAVLDNATGDVADDHYQRWVQDIALMKSLNVTAYRFSIAWSRILPSGRGDVNEAGLRFYDKLVNELLANNMEPWITLFHWDLPQALEDDFGGWLDSRTVDAFANYALIVFEQFASKVKRFITLNEPWT